MTPGQMKLTQGFFYAKQYGPLTDHILDAIRYWWSA